MAIIMYKKGDTHTVRGIRCTASVMKGPDFNFKAMEKAGWYLNPKDIPIDEPIDMPVVESEEIVLDEPVESEDLSDEDEIRQKAKAAGISSWHVKGIERLKEELKDAEQSEDGSD